MAKSGKKSGGVIKKIIIGIVLGVVLLFVFFYLGGPDYLQSFGEKAAISGKKLKKYEEATKESVKKVGEKVEDVTNALSSDKGKNNK